MPSTEIHAVTIVTRESRLALWQARHVQALLRERLGWQVELLGLTTRGDRILDRTLSKVGGKGLFVKELESALADGRAQIAVHSLKDVPMTLAEGYRLAAVLERGDPRDAFVSPAYDCLEALPEGAVVGTSSLRRQVLLHALRPDLHIEPLRGNLDTRLRKLDAGRYDAIVLAAAGLRRLDLGARIRMEFAPDVMLPAAGQGALGMEVHASSGDLAKWLQRFTHAPTLLATAAERAVSRALGGSCSVPLAAHAAWQADGTLQLAAAWGNLAGKRPIVRAAGSVRLSVGAGHPGAEVVAAAEALGAGVAAQLVARGASGACD